MQTGRATVKAAQEGGRGWPAMLQAVLALPNNLPLCRRGPMEAAAAGHPEAARLRVGGPA